MDEIRYELVQNQHNALNQLTARTVRGLGGLLLSDSTYAYDKRGNLIGETDSFNGTTQSYEYDATNKMVRGVNAKGETSAYTYNGLGILVAHTATTAEGTVTTEYVPDFTSPVESNLMAYGSDGVVYRHTYGVGLSKIASTVRTSADVLKLYVQNDRLGSGLFATDTQGELLGHVYRDQWGYLTNVEQPKLNGNPLNILDNFTNHEYDEILGIYYAKARFYDPVTMRFMAIDPIRDGTNWYMYAGNNPMRYTDPLGLRRVLDDGLNLPYKYFDELQGSGGTNYVIVDHNNITLSESPTIPGAKLKVITVHDFSRPDRYKNFVTSMMGVGFTQEDAETLFAYMDAYIGPNAVFDIVGKDELEAEDVRRLLPHLTVGAEYYAETAKGLYDLASKGFNLIDANLFYMQQQREQQMQAFAAVAFGMMGSGKRIQKPAAANAKVAKKWTNPDGSIKWPKNDGFKGKPTKKTLQPGTRIDRYGDETGRFASPEGTPYSERSLPPGSEAKPYGVYEVVKPIDVKAGTVASWFDQPGGGVQYQFNGTIGELINSGHLRRIP